MMQVAFDRPGRVRRGMLLVEAGASVMMLMIAMILTVKIVGWIAQENRADDRRRRALAEAANLMERLAIIPFEELTAESVGHVTLSPDARSFLPEADLSIGLAENDPIGGKDSKKLSLRIRWRNKSGEWESPVRLISWAYRSRSK